MWVGKAISLLRKFGVTEGGAAAVEFALILPVMLLAYVGTMEASALISMDRRIQTVSSVVGDLVARKEALVENDLLNFFGASTSIMTPYTTATLTQTITQIEVTKNRTVKVIDSFVFTNGNLTKRTLEETDDPYDLPEPMLDISLPAFIIASEASYSYTPFYGIVFDEPVNLYRQTFYLPRHGSTKRITMPGPS
ncbi:MAG TPA: TadE/TadG family type IV pilus assembly protein [Devosia sp.]|jgi:Flp pilus assembly pilin Flp|nr:TadE/TadG family type IV pilus assembly protein [Devosia sp.]